MSELMRLDEEYRSWIQELGDRYRTSQIKASIRVNNEMLMYYWSVGKDITERRADSKWGNKFFQNMSMDMSDMIPNAKGFSPTNLRYMMRFYGLFKDIVIAPQVGERLLENNGNQIVPQVEEQFEMAYSFFLTNNADAVIDAGTDKIIFLHHSAGKNLGFNLFSFSVSNSESDGWIFMLIAHGNAPFVLVWKQM